jgi:hypothetical protein
MAWDELPDCEGSLLVLVLVKGFKAEFVCFLGWLLAFLGLGVAAFVSAVGCEVGDGESVFSAVAGAGVDVGVSVVGRVGAAGVVAAGAGGGGE